MRYLIVYSITSSNQKLSYSKQKIHKFLHSRSIFYFFWLLFFSASLTPLLSQSSPLNEAISSESFVNWKDNTFFSTIQLDMQKAGLSLLAGRSAATNRMQQQLPLLVKNPLLTMTINSSTKLSSTVLWNVVSIGNIIDIIDEGYNTPSVYERTNEVMTMNHGISLNAIASLLILHTNPYTPNIPIAQVSSRPYSGIIIDARGTLPVHGEFVDSRVEPCLFPKIWDENMNLLYELNMVEPETVALSGLVTYSSSIDEQIYQERIGSDPLRITAREVFGIYRTDPVISRNEALKILSVPENVDLLRQGKVVLLLDDDALVYPVAAPLKTEAYYFMVQEVEDFVAINKMPDVEIKDGQGGVVFSVKNLEFGPDSAELLEEKNQLLDTLAQSLLIATGENENTILVEGHTASVGKLEGEQNLSVERAKAIIEALVERGVDENIFTYRGYGGTIPIGDNTTEEGRALNRRVEITVIPKETYIQRIY